MSLPDADREFLGSLGVDYEVEDDRGVICVVLRDWPLPAGFSGRRADLLIRVVQGYPDIAPDMWWFDPPVRLADGTDPPRTDAREKYLGRTWQRWSRHLTSEQWHSGSDGLENYIALIGGELVRSVLVTV